MIAASTAKGRPAAGRRRGSGKRRKIYSSKRMAVDAMDNGLVVVDFSLSRDSGDLLLLKDALLAAGPKAAPKGVGKTLTDAAAKVLAGALEKVAERFLRDAFSNEFDMLVSQYRAMLRETLVTGDDTVLKTALNRARLQERILASAQMADQSEACELLGLSSANPSATMKRKEENHDLLRFTVDGRAVYPLLQFDVERRRVYPAMSRIIAAKPNNWSDFRLLNWLLQPHLDFDDTPGAALGSESEAVIAAFAREVEPEVHG